MPEMKKKESIWSALRNYLCFCGQTKETYQAILPQIMQSNVHMIRVTTAILAFTQAAMFIISLFLTTLAKSRPLYLGALLFLGCVHVLLNRFEDRHPNFILFIMYMLIGGVYLFGMILSFVTTSVVNAPSVTFVCLLALIPGLFTDRPWRMNLFSILTACIFLAISRIHNTPAVFEANAGNILFLMFLSFLLYQLISGNTCRRLAADLEIRRESENTNRRQTGLIEALADIIESRDADTGGHIERTGAYMAAFLERLKKDRRYKNRMTEEYVSLIKDATPLHDMGKIKISDTILNKPSRLTPEEFQVMKKHTVYGAEIIDSTVGKFSDRKDLQVARNIALSHHERWDGKGYPEGLAGETIPFEARLMALVDVYDALISKRVYKSIMPHDEAVRTIAEGRGTQFDPDLTDIFLELIREERPVSPEADKETA